MSGTEAAATLSLEINTNGAETKLATLAAAYNDLKASLSGNVSASGISSATNKELDAVRKELAATKAAYVSLNETVEGFKKKMATPVGGAGSGTGMFATVSKEAKVFQGDLAATDTRIERTTSNLRIMLATAEMSGKARVKLADLNESGLNSTLLAKNLGIQRQITEQMVGQAKLRELNVSGTRAAELAAVVGEERQVTAQMTAQAKLRELNVSGTRAAELAKVLAAEKLQTAELAKQVALDKILATRSGQDIQRLVSSRRVAATVNDPLQVPIADRLSAYKTTKAANTASQWMVDDKEIAAAIKMQSEVDKLEKSHTKATPAVVAHTKAVNAFAGAAGEAHAFARGLSGSLGTLWMTYGSMVPLMAGAALAGGFMQAAKAGSEFAYQLSFVKALGGESAESVAQIGTAALNLSKTSMYGPVELANGLRILSQAGLDAKASMQALPSAMQLATVGEMSMEQASVTLVGVMNAFGESLGALPHIGDMFAKAAAMSQTSVGGMAEAMKTASVVHDQYGASIEDTATAITLLAKVNITGTAAGTSYRNMLKDLYTPSKQAGQVIEQLGLKTKDAMGNLREAPEIMFDLQKILKGYTQGSQTDILGKIFSERGGKEAIQILNQTRESWDAMKSSISNSDGFMSNVTSELEMTTKGRFKQALNTMQSNLIGAFDASEGSVRGLADALRNLADSPEFVSGINAIVGGMATLASTVVNLLPLLASLGAAWAVFKGVGVLVGGLSAASAAMGTLSAASTIFAAEAVVAGGGIAGMHAGLVALTGSAATAAGVGGLGALSATLLALPLTAAVAGLGYLAYKLYEVENSTPAAVAQLNSFNDVLDRELVKLKATNNELEKRFSLLNGGNDSDQAVSEAQARRSAAVTARDAAQAKIPKVLVDENLPIEGYSSEISAQQQAVAKANAAIAREDKLLGELSVEQARSNGLSLVNTLKETSQQVEKLKSDAAHSKKKLDTSQIESFIEGAYNNSGMSPESLRKMKEQLGRMTLDLQKDLNGGGDKTFVAEKPPKAGAALKTQALDARANKAYLDYYVSEYKAEEALNKSNVQSKLESEEAYRENLLSIADKYNDNIATRYALEVEKLNGLRGKGSADEQALAEINYWKLLKDQDTFLNSKNLALKESYNRESKTHNEGIAAVAKQIAEQEAVTRQAIEGFARERLKLGMSPADAAYYDASQASSNKSDKGIADLTSKKDSMLAITNDDGVAIYTSESRAIKDLIEQINMLTESKARLADASGSAARVEAEYKRSFSYGWDTAFKTYADNAANSAATAQEVFVASTTFMEGALNQFITTGKVGWKDLAASALASVAKTMANKAMSSFLGIVADFGLSLLGGGSTGSVSTSGGSTVPGFSSSTLGNGLTLKSANGNAFSGSSSLHQYVNTVQTSPKSFVFDTLHGFAKGGVFAEAGPEAVMPLSRDSAGRLGVKSQGGGGNNVAIEINVNVTEGSASTDASGDKTGAWTEFSGKIKSMIIDQMVQEKRPGGLLYS